MGQSAAAPGNASSDTIGSRALPFAPVELPLRGGRGITFPIRLMRIFEGFEYSISAHQFVIEIAVCAGAQSDWSLCAHVLYANRKYASGSVTAPVIQLLRFKET